MKPFQQCPFWWWLDLLVPSFIQILPISCEDSALRKIYVNARRWGGGGRTDGRTTRTYNVLRLRWRRHKKYWLQLFLCNRPAFPHATEPEFSLLCLICVICIIPQLRWILVFCSIWFSLVLCVPSVLWHCWLGHLTRKNRPRCDL